MLEALEQAVGDDRLESVELELAGLGGEADRDIVADYFESDLIDHLGNNRVDLSGHDAGSRLPRRQVDFVESGSGAARQQAQVVAYLGKFHRHPLQHAGDLHESARVLGRLHQVLRRDQVDSRDLREPAADQRRIFRMRGNAGSDRRRSQVDLADERGGLLQPVLILAHHHRVGAELLTKRHGDGVLQLGAPHLEDVGKLLRLRGERAPQLDHGVDEAGDGEMQRHLHGGRIHVIGALADVYMLVRVQVLVFAASMTEYFQSTVGDDLIGVHVGRGACAALNDIDDELIVKFAGADFFTSFDDGGGPRCVEQSQLVVRQRGRLLYASKRFDQVGIDRDVGIADLKVFDGAQRVDTEISLIRNTEIAQEIVLGTEISRMEAAIAWPG